MREASAGRLHRESAQAAMGARIVRHLAEHAVACASGTSETGTRILDNRPKDRFFVGNLAAPSQGATDVKNRIAPTALGVRFRVLHEDLGQPIVVQPVFALYYRAFPTYEEQLAFTASRQGRTPESLLNILGDVPQSLEFREVWKRVEVPAHEVEVAIPWTAPGRARVDLAGPIAGAVASARADPDFFGFAPGQDRKPTFPPAVLASRQAYLDHLASRTDRSFPTDWAAVVEVEALPDLDQPTRMAWVSVDVVNATQQERGYDEPFEPALFGARLRCVPGRVQLQPWRHRFPEPETREDPLLDAFVETQRVAAGRNCQVRITPEGLETSAHAEFEQPSQVPRTHLKTLDGREVPLLFTELARDPFPLLDRVLHEMRAYEAAYRGTLDMSSPLVRRRVEDFTSHAERFGEGVRFLRSDARAGRAFRLMNETFRAASGFGAWRLFQLVFIVQNLKGVVEREDDKVDLLYIATAAGKSETYFGLVVFTMFHDRLAGKRAGVSAWSKFPLRMLSLQQTQRAARLVVWAEEVRRSPPDGEAVPGEPFSLGYYVGNTEDFPRHAYEIRKNLHAQRGRLLDECPLCERRGKRGELLLKLDESSLRSCHQCQECGNEALLYVSDDETFRYLPTFVISTVDKLVAGAWNDGFRSLLGGKLWRCPTHGYTSRPTECLAYLPPDGGHPKHCKARPGKAQHFPPPTLMIQDELHLVRETFGTLDSHIETFLHEAAKALSVQDPPKGFKTIGLTATVAGVANQLRHLYSKEARVFPGQAPSDELDFFIQHDAGAFRRLIVGVKPHDRTPDYASYRFLQYAWERVHDLMDDPSPVLLRSAASEEAEEARALLRMYRTFLCYQLKVLEVDNFDQSIEKIVNKDLVDAGYPPIIGKTLTGGTGLDDLKEVIRRLKRTGDDDPERIDLVVATSVISHGVDIDELNVMAFQGVPRSVAEYIQSLSRIGRRVPGLVFVSFYPYRPRDQSFFAHFDSIHRHLYKLVEDVPINRWSSMSLDHSYTTLLFSALNVVYGNKYERDLRKAKPMRVCVNDEAFSEELKLFLEKVYCVPRHPAPESYGLQIRREAEERLVELRKFLDGEYGPVGENKVVALELGDRRGAYDPRLRVMGGIRGIQETIDARPTNMTFKLLHREGAPDE